MTPLRVLESWVLAGIGLCLLHACSGSGATTQGTAKGLSTAPPIQCADYATCEFACNEGRTDSCTELARMFESGQGAPQNLAHAADLYERACRMQGRDACAHLALMYDVGLGVAHDRAFAAYWYETACALGDSWSCTRKTRLQTQRD